MQTHHRFTFTNAALDAMIHSYVIQMDYRNPETDPQWFDINDEPIMDDGLLMMYFQGEPVMFQKVAIPCIKFAIHTLGYPQSLFTNSI